MLIYKVTNKINGKGYIGKTVKSKEERWAEHVSYARTPETILHFAICKYGREAFEVTILEDGISEESVLNERERFYIKEHKTYPPGLGFGYNMTPGGDGNSNPSPETRKRMSAGVKASLTPERRERLRQLALNMPQSQKDQISSSVKAHTSSPEFARRHSERVKEGMAKISLEEMQALHLRQARTRTGRKKSEQAKENHRRARAKQANVAKGWKKDPASVVKSTQALKDWHASLTPEERKARIEKQRASLLAFYANNKKEKQHGISSSEKAA